MSQGNVEIVRAAAAAYNSGDLDALMEFHAAEVVFVTLLLGNHRGKEAVRPIFEQNQRNLSGYRLDLDELIDGLIVRRETFRNKAEALEATGLSE
jgi:ketosteroid isomerase-like protein